MTRTRLIMMFLLLWPASAFASCYNYCDGLCAQGSGNLDRNTCTLRCTNNCVEDSNGNHSFTGTAPAISPPHNYGAIALSPTTLAFGHSINFASEELAAQEAMSHCHDDNEAKPADCKILLSFADSCASLALLQTTNTPGGSWGTAWAPTQEEASTKALASCKVMANAQCRIAHSACTQPTAVVK